jgi:hypothetical protein
VAGEPFPPLSPRGWEAHLRDGLERVARPSSPRFRLVRAEGRRAIAEVDHAAIRLARSAWNGPIPSDPRLTLVTRRTWGTLVGAKQWLRRRPATGSR